MSAASRNNRRLVLRLALAFAALLLLGVVLLYPFRGPVVLNDYLAELRAKGGKPTYAEQLASLSTNTGHCLQVLPHVLDQIESVSPGVRSQLVGMALVISVQENCFRSAGPDRLEISFRQPTPPWAGTIIVGKAGDWEASSKCMARTEPALLELRKVLKNPDLNAGQRTDVFEAVTPFRAVRDASSWLVYDAIVALHDNSRSRALQDIEALAGLSNLHREEYSLVSQMVRAAVVQLGVEVTWQSLHREGWSDAELATMQASWEKVELLEGLERALQGEIGFGLEAAERLSESQKKIGMGRQLFRKHIQPNDLLFRSQNVQARVELIHELREGRSWPKVESEMDELNAQIDAKGGFPRKFLYILTLTGTPNYFGAMQQSIRTETKLRIAVTAIALQRYQLRHLRFPDRLEQLVPEILASVPVDPMSGKQLLYHMNTDKTFTLYSTGEDGEDNGGNPAPANRVTHGWSRRESGRWEGRDTVWPSPAIAAPPQVLATHSTKSTDPATKE